MKIERCSKCDEPTGKAGIGEDSFTIDGISPLCEECFDRAKMSEDMTREELFKLIHTAFMQKAWKAKALEKPFRKQQPITSDEWIEAESQIKQLLQTKVVTREDIATVLMNTDTLPTGKQRVDAIAIWLKELGLEVEK